MSSYSEVFDYLSAQFDTVNGYDFYRFIFPHGECVGEICTDFSKPNAIYLYRDEADVDSKRELRRRIMLNDTWEKDYMKYVEQNSMTLCSGLTYRQRANKLENAQAMNALIFDLDGVGLHEIRTLFCRFGKDCDMLRTLPMPTFIVLSGTGLHLYYVFDTPIDLFPNIKLQMKALKYDLTFRIWEYKSTSTKKQIEYQSINQGFRMVGSVNEKHDREVVAFRVGDKVSLETMNSYARFDENRVDVNKRFRPSKAILAKAKEEYPEWYQRVIVEGNKRAKKWDINSKQGFALYDWWRNRVTEIRGGHRYFFLMCMAIYACKCDVPKDKLEADMQEVFDVLRNIEYENPLTQKDIDSAMECYSREFYNFKIDDIEKLTELRIERNSRNYRSQKLHLRMARSNLAIMNEDRGTALQGRPSAQEKVQEWRKENPTGRKVDCHSETKLSRVTINKWWESVDTPIIN